MLLKSVAIKSPIFVPCSPIFSLACASIQRSNGVEDFSSESKTTNGRSPIFPYSRLFLSVPGAEGEGAVVKGEGAVVGGEGAIVGGEGAIVGGEGAVVEGDGAGGGEDSR